MGLVVADSTASRAEPFGAPFYGVPLVRFVVFALLGWGFYDMYWLYRNFRSRGGHRASRLSCLVKAIFGGISFAFVAADVERARGRSVGRGFLVGGVYLALVVSQRLPDPWWLLFVLRVLPLAVTAGSLAKVTPPAAPPLKAWQIALCAVGALFTVLAILGTFLPEDGDDLGSVVSGG
jgi:hypothetical protein